ncbi:MAG: hypothetical protein IJZ82_10900 [Lachnospiraceae bacterium]|nr:hypothetical protein [Lachnospiraceae bacterium]
METVLKHWYIEMQFGGRTKIARGNVFHSPKFVNNQNISTSKIAKIVKDDIRECLEIHTKNSIYYCYWRDCDFESCRADSKYIPDFEKYRKRYVEEALLPIEKDSIVLVSRSRENYFPYVFYCQEKGVCMQDLYLENVPIIIPLDSKDEAPLEAEIRYSYQQRKQYCIYYMDIPDGVTLYVENQSEKAIQVCNGGDIIDIAAGARKEVMTGYQPDYLELARDSRMLPKKMEQFDERAVIQELNHNGGTNLYKTYMITRKWYEKNEDGVQDERIQLLAAGAVAMALLTHNYELAKQLVEAGVSFALEDSIILQFYNTNGLRMASTELVLMEWLASNWEIPEDIYTFLWSKAREHSMLPLQSPLELRLNYEAVGDSVHNDMIKQLLILDKVWKEAAAEYLMAVAGYFLKTKLSPSEEVWDIMFEKFLDMRRCLIQKIVSFYMPCHRYGGREKIIAFWKIYMQHEEAEQVKITQIYVFREQLSDLCSEKEDMTWFLSMLLEKGSSFEELELGARDACVRFLLLHKETCNYVWSSLLSTDFIPAIYVDDYITSVKNSTKKYLIPLLVSAKFKAKENPAKMIT